jgi:hypothetical protein
LSEKFFGSCHCGKVRFAVTLDARKPLEAVECDCSICTMKGFLHVIVTRDAFEILQGEDALTTYTFNTGVAKHTFCNTCGVHPFYVPRSHPDGIDVNLRCFDDVDGVSPRARFSIRPFHGREWEKSIDTIR